MIGKAVKRRIVLDDEQAAAGGDEEAPLPQENDATAKPDISSVDASPRDPIMAKSPKKKVKEEENER